MTIGRKLYIGFGSILGILVLLFLIGFTASQREHSARNTGASHSRQSKPSKRYAFR